MSDSTKIIIHPPQDNTLSQNAKFARMFRELSSQFRELSDRNKRHVSIVSLLLTSPLSSDADYFLDVDYWLNEKTYDDLTDENYKWTLRRKHTPEIEEKTVLDGASLNCQIIRLPQGYNQWDAIILLNKAAEAIEKLDDAVILDIIHHSWIDDDGIDHPFIRIYYTK